jgi:hypothetical protein
MLFVDGRKCASRTTLGRLEYQLEPNSSSPHQD